MHCLCSTALPFPPTCKRDKPCVNLWSRYLISQVLHHPGSYALLIRLFFFHFLYIIFVHSVHLCYYYSIASRPILVIYGEVILNQPLAILQYSSERSSRPINLNHLFIRTNQLHRNFVSLLPESVSTAARSRFIYQPPLYIIVTSS